MKQKWVRRRTLRLAGRTNRLARVSAVFLTAACSALLAWPVTAQEGGNTAVSDTHTAFRWINFGIVLALIVWGFAKAGPSFRKNAEEISRKIAEGARAREAAEKQRQEVQSKLAKMDDEVAQLRADAKRAMDGEVQRLRALAKEEAQNIERAGQVEIAAAERAARTALKAQAGRLAITQAEVVLRDQMTPEAEAGLFKAFIEELQETRN
jgi:F-type H+-transporting ATPase subunit b